ncbi:MAG: riboflavin synthase [Proteobacteria bacterium]|nr:riboflavin synthase [Pseudomonadota bacterium]
MFTGLIEGRGAIERRRTVGGAAVLSIRPPWPVAELSVGESVAVGGVCLTVTALEDTIFLADVSAETLSRTTLGRLRPGAAVNLERALRLGDRLGGHLVSGHVDGVGRVARRREEGTSIRFRFTLPVEVGRYVVAKGSIAVDGVSLTVNAVGADHAEVNVIPHTARVTTLLELKVGDEINIEGDLVAKYVERLLGFGPGRGGMKSKLDQETLARLGYI